jgi:hypothetical protein
MSAAALTTAASVRPAPDRDLGRAGGIGRPAHREQRRDESAEGEPAATMVKMDAHCPRVRAAGCTLGRSRSGPGSSWGAAAPGPDSLGRHATSGDRVSQGRGPSVAHPRWQVRGPRPPEVAAEHQGPSAGAPDGHGPGGAAGARPRGATGPPRSVTTSSLELGVGRTTTPTSRPCANSVGCVASGLLSGGYAPQNGQVSAKPRPTPTPSASRAVGSMPGNEKGRSMSGVSQIRCAGIPARTTAFARGLSRRRASAWSPSTPGVSPPGSQKS